MCLPLSPVEFSSHCRFYKLSHSMLGMCCSPAGRRVCLQVTWEVVLPRSPVEFSSFCHSHKLSCSRLLGALPRSHQSLSDQARLIYLQFPEGFPSSSLRSSGCPTLFAMCLYSYCLLISFSFFPGWGGRSVHGAMLIWPRVVCGSTTYHLAHVVCMFPSHLHMGVCRPQGPPGFSI
jgi:hypothetical protein